MDVALCIMNIFIYIYNAVIYIYIYDADPDSIGEGRCAALLICCAAHLPLPMKAPPQCGVRTSVPLMTEFIWRQPCMTGQNRTEAPDELNKVSHCSDPFLGSSSGSPHCRLLHLIVLFLR
eukprot:GHVU01124352.1.p2 GENE.GHVU01124352.1~~GHVU01124352.1.p2  ORF type:complete len:120 (+),score=13.36 GHVU01124352.1:656-1015(+)